MEDVAHAEIDHGVLKLLPSVEAREPRLHEITGFDAIDNEGNQGADGFGDLHTTLEEMLEDVLDQHGETEYHKDRLRRWEWATSAESSCGYPLSL